MSRLLSRIERLERRGQLNEQVFVGYTKTPVTAEFWDEVEHILNTLSTEALEARPYDREVINEATEALRRDIEVGRSEL